MRRVALLLTAAALAATAAPASAITKTVYVPILGCTATFETNDIALGANSRGLYAYRTGTTRAEGHCSFA